MIETIAAVSLPVDEKLEIRKNRILPEAGTAQEKGKESALSQESTGMNLKGSMSVLNCSAGWQRKRKSTRCVY